MVRDIDLYTEVIPFNHKNGYSIWPAFIVFLTILLVFLITFIYVGQRLLREENQRKAHELNVDLLSQQINHHLSKRLQVILTLSLNRHVKDVLKRIAEPDNPRIRLALNTANEVAHSELILVFDREGTVISSTNNKTNSLTGFNYSFRPYFKKSIDGQNAIFPAVGAITKTRGLYMSAPVFVNGERRPSGVIALKIPISEAESILQKQSDKTALVSPDGIILSSNEPEWIYRSIRPISDEIRKRLLSTRQFGEKKIKNMELDLSRNYTSIDGFRHHVLWMPLPITGWKILSCRTKKAIIPLPPIHRYILTTAVCVFGGLALLIFFLGANIHRRRRTERMLHKTEEKYYNIFKNATMGIFQSTPDGRFIEASPSLADILGYDNSSEMISHVEDIGSEIYVHSEDRKLFISLLEAQGRVNGFETRFFRKDGDIIWVSLTGRMVSGDMVLGRYLEGFCLDITEKKQAEEALRREKDIVSRVMETSPVGIMLVDDHERITFANSRAEEILNLERDRKDPKHYSQPQWKIADINGQMLLESETPNAKVKKTGESLNDARVYIKWPEGKKVLLSLNIAPLFDKNQNITGMVSVFEDITEKVKAQKESAMRQQQLMLADRMISLGILTSGVAHEINNPNTFIMANAQLLDDAWREACAILDQYYQVNGDFSIGGLRYSKFREKFPQLSMQIIKGARKIKRIVKELRDFSYPDTDNLMEGVNVNEVIRSAEILLANMIKQSTHRFVLKLDSNLPLIKGNFQRLEQVIINLLQNSCQALPSVDRGISIETRHEPNENEVVIVCQDDGIGIPEYHLRYVTDPFFTTKRDAGGTGLGLSISLNILRELGGSMNIHSRPGEGTRITLHIPVTADKNRKNRGTDTMATFLTKFGQSEKRDSAVSLINDMNDMTGIKRIHLEGKES